MKPIWVRPKKACELGGFGMTKCYELMADNTLESRTVGRMRLISVASIERLGQGAQCKVDANTDARNCDEEQISHNSRWRAP